MDLECVLMMVVWSAILLLRLLLILTLNVVGWWSSCDNHVIQFEWCIMVQALRKEPMTVYGDGKQTRSFQYVSDLVSDSSLYLIDIIVALF